MLRYGFEQSRKVRFNFVSRGVASPGNECGAGGGEGGYVMT